jgi:HSP20 family protein
MANLNVRKGEQGEQRGMTRAGEQRWMMDPFRMLQSLMSGDPFGGMTAPGSTLFAPDIEVKESQDAYKIRADLPGVREDDVEVSITGNQLTISGTRQEEKRDEGDRYYVYERSYGRFSRTLILPESADMEHVQANLSNGVLELSVPKRAEAQPRRIPVGGQKAGGEKETGQKTGEAKAGSEKKAA